MLRGTSILCTPACSSVRQCFYFLYEKEHGSKGVKPNTTSPDLPNCAQLFPAIFSLINF